MQVLINIKAPDLDYGTLYDEIAFKQYLEDHDVEHLTDNQINELIELFNKAYQWDQ